ncbi:MAG: serine/threonine protein kinase [Deltaproteobacteria bacterium]|nr:MAG: serine/threonine protein kinase [Deltaproteobacteria bacterium]
MAEPTFNPGQQIEDYVIEKRMGKGGMAELFLAEDVVLKRKVVIKVLGLPYRTKEDFTKQFLKEARIQANLDNPHIVQILRVFNYHHNHCLVMPLIKGTDLARVIKKAKLIRESKGGKGALSVERAVHIFLQILEGIGFAHKYKIIHGDIKPSNILLDQQGRAKVADFGLAFLSPYGKNKKGEMSLVGTPSYMSPEQILNEEVDLRSDIYSLGVTFFNMLTGRFPLGDKVKSTELLEFHLEGSLDRAKRTLDEFKDIRPNIKEAILKALGKDPNDRHQSCLEFSLAIKEDAPYEMYSELLRFSLLTKDEITSAERAYLDKIAARKGLGPKEAKALEINMRKEMRLPPLNSTRED